MKTESNEYNEYLKRKYLPGRSFYLRTLLYPVYLKKIEKHNNEIIYDLGCGTGEFLNYCKSKNIPAIGFDSNPFLIEMNTNNGLNAEYVDILEIHKKDYLMHYAICDNVLEHLSEEQLKSFFCNLKKVFVKGGVLLIIVPCEKGFKSDPTHKTFVDERLIDKLCLDNNYVLESYSYLPVNQKILGKFLYLQMTIFKIII